MLILANIKPSKDKGVREIVKNNFPTDLLPVSEFFVFEDTDMGVDKEEEIIARVKKRIIRVMSDVAPFMKQYTEYMKEKREDGEESVLSLSFRYVLYDEDEDKTDEECVVSYVSPDIEITKTFLEGIEKKKISHDEKANIFISEIIKDILLYKTLIIDASSNETIEEVSREEYKKHFLSEAERGVLEWV